MGSYSGSNKSIKHRIVYMLMFSLISLLFFMLLIVFYDHTGHSSFVWHTYFSPRMQYTRPKGVDVEWTVELTIRMTASEKMMHRFFCEAIRSAVLFWSAKLGPIRLLLDEEDRNNDFARKISTFGLSHRFLVEYVAAPVNPKRFAQVAAHVHKSPGYVRQLYDSYLMDMYTNASVIAWIDTDTIFTTIVTRERIARNGKLIVKGMNTFNRLSWVPGWDQANRVQLGLPMVSDFMVYFPVYLYPKTIRKCREWIMKKFNSTSFEDTFVDSALSGPHISVSPVSVILSYAYYFERDQYDWHLDIGPDLLVQYNKRFSISDHHVNLADTNPEPHVSVHSGYFADFYTILSQTFCTTNQALGLRNGTDCQGLPGSRQLLLYEFCTDPWENHIDTWCAGDGRKTCLSILAEHEKNMRSWFSTHPDLMKKEAAEYVEEFASSKFAIKCPRVVL